MFVSFTELLAVNTFFSRPHPTPSPLHMLIRLAFFPCGVVVMDPEQAPRRPKQNSR